MIKNKKIKLFLDGPSLDQIRDLQDVDGYTFNPSLFKKLGAKDYIKFSKMILKETKNLPVSIEVFADDEESCFNQAKTLNELGKNVFVKIPITFTNGKSTAKLIEKLVNENIKLNITAIFTFEQIREIHDIVKDTGTILSIFSGRIYDIGKDARKIFKEISQYVRSNSKCETLWASCRMPYDIIDATNCEAHIITMGPDMVKKLAKFNKSSEEYSLETVKGFYDDAKSSGFKI